MDRLVVIGAGIMGLRICRHFLGCGHPVALVDPSAEALEKAMAFLDGAPEGSQAASFSGQSSGFVEPCRLLF